ncbi:MAG TPA: hypothetical protein VFC60_01525 [Tissierellaceae bacterium]|nr:hypothetical protein [Tissierellaceae bacterium]
MAKIVLDKTIKGTILDIGSGGESIIARICQIPSCCVRNSWRYKKASRDYL